jgi:hypothetical protein
MTQEQARYQRRYGLSPAPERKHGRVKVLNPEKGYMFIAGDVPETSRPGGESAAAPKLVIAL